jgi:hypothetical protein
MALHEDWSIMVNLLKMTPMTSNNFFLSCIVPRSFACFCSFYHCSLRAFCPMPLPQPQFSQSSIYPTDDVI